MPDVDISIEVTGLEEAQEYFTTREIPRFVGMHLEEVMHDLVDYARSIAPRKTGRYAESIFFEKVHDLKFIFGSRWPYAAVIEYGSMAHPIIPRARRALKFETDGETVFARYVLHPGTMPFFVIHRTKRENAEKIYNAIREGTAEAMKK